MMIIPPTSVVRRRGDRITPLFVAAAYDRLWHFSAVPTALSNVGFRGVDRSIYAQSEFFAFCRVGPGNFTPSLSQIRT